MHPCAYCHNPIHERENYWKVDEAYLHIGDCYWNYKRSLRLSTWPNTVFRIQFDEPRAVFLILAVLYSLALMGGG